MGQGQPRVIIWTTLVELPYTMLHTKFQGHRSIGSGEEDFLRFLPYNFGRTPIHNATYLSSRPSVYWFWRRRFFKVFTIYGHGGHVGHVTQLIYINFHSYYPSSFHMNFGSKLPYCFWEKPYMPYLTLWDKISQNSAYLKADSQKNFQISQNF